LNKRKTVAGIYNNKLKDVPEVKIPNFFFEKTTSPFVYVIILEDNFSEKDRDAIVEEMNKKTFNAVFIFNLFIFSHFIERCLATQTTIFLLQKRLARELLLCLF